MELKIYNPQDDGFVQKIEWNYEELKTEVVAAADSYAVSVYTDDTIKQAKADRAKLNKFVDALKGKRTEIRKKLLEPDGPFGQEVQDVISIVQRAIDLSLIHILPERIVCISILAIMWACTTK